METISSTTWRTRLKWFLPIGCVALLCGTYMTIRSMSSAAEGARDVKVTLAVQVASSTEVWTTLTFANHSNQDFYVNKDKGCFVVNPEEKRNFVSNGAVFQIAAAGRSIIWRRFWEPTPKKDALVLKPGQVVQTKVNLLETYDFLPGTHEYTIVYSALHGEPNPTLVRLTSNEVRFSFHYTPTPGTKQR